MGDGRQNFIDTIANIVNEGKANIDEDKQTITFKSRHWSESRIRIEESGPQGMLFLFDKAEDHLRGSYNEIKKRLN
jgi:uncharacterized protein with gpF-like domain|tara:strand:- start:929 stop:1156 length:228 start_codon:yes stop_codon:yes gene_type:complete